MVVCAVVFVASSLLALALSGCGQLRARTVSDVAHDACELFMVERAEVRMKAQRQGVSPLDVARALCAANEVVRPFLMAGREAAPEAVMAAQRMGALPK